MFFFPLYPNEDLLFSMFFLFLLGFSLIKKIFGVLPLNKNKVAGINGDGQLFSNYISGFSSFKYKGPGKQGWAIIFLTHNFFSRAILEMIFLVWFGP